MRRPSLYLLLSLLIASSASAVTMDWTPIGNPGNTCDPQPDGEGGIGCYGAVPYAYSIGTYEVTNAQYAEFLNAKAASDPLALYNTGMGNGNDVFRGGITRGGSPGFYTYSTITGRENMPVNYVTFFDAMRFANWLNNGKGTGDTETGAYTLVGGTPTPGNGQTVTRNARASIVLPTEDEWYKAAYYDAQSVSFYDYPTGADAQPACAAPTAAPNSANCDGPGDDFQDADVDNFTIVGSYSGSASPYGTFDQGGNVFEWNETITRGCCRIFRGGDMANLAYHLGASDRGPSDPSADPSNGGFRVAMVPEPGTGLLVIAGLVGLAVRRRAPA